MCQKCDAFAIGMGTTNLVQKFLVEQEFGQWTLGDHQFVQCGDLSSKIALTVVLLFQEVTGQVVDQL